MKACAGIKLALLVRVTKKNKSYYKPLNDRDFSEMGPFILHEDSIFNIQMDHVVWREIAPDPNSPKQICLGLFEDLICTLIFGKFAGRDPGAQPPGAQANLRKLALRNRAN